MENRSTQRNTSRWSKVRAHSVATENEHGPKWRPVRVAAAAPTWGAARSVVDITTRGWGVLRISGFQVSGMIEGFLGFEMFDFGIFWVGKVWQVFCWVA